ncbi:MAG: hypothetical protein EOO38_25895 [Cytophagaceae bacterium]|nr:MAG: hypothetical protein EOO38_25895 [Cytophagaceae bacterium]
MKDLLPEITNQLNDVLRGLRFFIPELYLTALFIVVLVTDLLFGKRSAALCRAVAIGGMILVIVQVISQKLSLNANDTARFFSGMLLLHHTAIVFKLIIDVLALMLLFYFSWDKKLAKKKAHRDNVAFQDFSQDANKIYKRQVREMAPDTANYEAEKMAAVERAAASGGLEIVETEDGELIAVDKDGSFYSTKDSTEFVGNKPSKEKIDKLVGEIQKAEEVRLKKRKERSGKEEDGDVTYINDKNKQVCPPLKSTECWIIANKSYSLTKSWRDSTTSTPRRSETVSREEPLFESIMVSHFFSILSSMLQG